MFDLYAVTMSAAVITLFSFRNSVRALKHWGNTVSDGQKSKIPEARD